MTVAVDANTVAYLPLTADLTDQCGNIWAANGGTVNQAVNASITGLSTGEHYLQIKNNQANYYVFDAVKVDDGCELRPYSASPTSSSTRRRGVF